MCLLPLYTVPSYSVVIDDGARHTSCLYTRLLSCFCTAIHFYLSFAAHLFLLLLLRHECTEAKGKEMIISALRGEAVWYVFLTFDAAFCARRGNKTQRNGKENEKVERGSTVEVPIAFLSCTQIPVFILSFLSWTSCLLFFNILLFLLNISFKVH